MGTYTIGQVAERSGFSPSQLRYYETHGLLAPAGRRANGYRMYDDSALERLRFIDRTKQLGCSLSEIAALVALWDADECGPVQARLHVLVTDKIAAAQQRTAELAELTTQLRRAASQLRADADDGPCHDTCACLAAPPAGGPSTPVVQPARNEAAVACTLPSEAVAHRVRAWRSVLAHVDHRSSLPGGGLRVGLGADVPLAELTRLVVAEQACCTFFAFTITVDERGIALEVRAPADAGAIVAAVFGETA